MPWSYDMLYRTCPWCGVRDAHMNHHSATDTQSIGGGTVRKWNLMSCPRCAGIVVLETEGPSVPSIPGGVGKVLPEHDVGVGIAHLPHDVERFFRDAQRVLDAGVPDAAAVQLRRTLEAAAAHFEIDSGPLIQRIKQLIAKGLITSEFGKVLDHIRKVGNVGAHAMDEKVDDQTAQRAMRFTTQVLRNLFEIPAELTALEQESTDEDEDDGT